MAASSSSTWHRTIIVLATLVVVMLVMVCLYWGRTVLVPVALSILLTFMLSPIVSALQRRRLGRTPSVIIVVIVTGLLLSGLGWFVALQVANFADDLPSYQENMQQKYADLRDMSRGGTIDRLVATIQEAAKELQKEDP